MCTVLLPPGGYPTEVNKYIISMGKGKGSSVCLQTALQSNWFFCSAVLEQEFVLYLYIKGNLQQIRSSPIHKDVYGEYSYVSTGS